MNKNIDLSRREFLKLGGLVAGGLALPRWSQNLFQGDFPQADHLGRIADPVVELRVAPNIEAQSLGKLYEDQMVVYLREVVGSNIYRPSQRWVETPEGYVWSPLVQPVKNIPNEAVTELPQTSLGQGMWVQVSVPYIDVALENSAPIAPSVKFRIENGQSPRLYYSQVIWVDQINVAEDGRVWYRLNEKFGYGDIFWGPAEAFRPMSREEVEPISPEVENKVVEVNLARQSLSCFEDGSEVFYTRVSTGMVGEETETPIGGYHIWRKMLSSHMSGGTTGGGWDLPGVGFTTLFIGSGIAIHSTFWHNNYGEKTSRGCVNVRPEDAQYIWRWVHPAIGYDPGDITVSGTVGSLIRIVEY
ncbi:MAG: hypothetical protein DWQ07_07085 [Chloroflexi bacterium]|nr:MAG: hypothetical protein DWQ07_07085 [Chloroflexota bacterium]MBL1195534.1 hypothetical protein [Chloroflexota bacterium]NOH12816.1 L,D-transpeptidase [Chloroflexota bacterium]